MNDNTTQLIEKLATKLGTTSEYLWSVLVKQAPISALSNGVEMLIVALLGFILWRLHKKFCKKDANDYDAYENLGPLLGAPMIIGAVIFAILSIGYVFTISTMISAIFNPEYWALQQILNVFNK